MSAKKPFVKSSYLSVSRPLVAKLPGGEEFNFAFYPARVNDKTLGDDYPTNAFLAEVLASWEYVDGPITTEDGRQVLGDVPLCAAEIEALSFEIKQAMMAAIVASVNPSRAA